MARRNGFSYGKIAREDINEEIRLISISDTDYITPSCRIYKLCFNGKFIEKLTRINKHNGYVYCGITCKDGEQRQRRVHRLVALAFIHNPDPQKYDMVGHWNNIKSDNRLENLYWTNGSENTKKAVDDGLLVNDIGVYDNQSTPVAFYKNSGELVGVYGSIIQASKHIKNFSSSSIAKVVDKTTRGIKGYYFSSITSEQFHDTDDYYKNLVYEVSYIKKVKTPVEVFKDGVSLGIFETQKAIERELGIPQGAIAGALKTGGKVFSVFTFKRVEVVATNAS